ncbi:hypothetical protein VNO78_23482 [Psophocarpus tetragonolobus]|uniref:Auxin-induced protein n=1 Tax=Psophocarpus tetragonolobus TaxID=3891 RepID=A0AAN9S3B1_PSOTE
MRRESNLSSGWSQIEREATGSGKRVTLIRTGLALFRTRCPVRARPRLEPPFIPSTYSVCRYHWMELQLGLGLPATPSKLLDLNSRAQDPWNNRKRTHTLMIPTTLSLLPSHHHYCDGDEGWPPLNNWRKKLRVGGGNNNDEMVWVGASCATLEVGGYIKVKMEGVGIARKVHLRTHQSFKALKETLMNMFGKSHQQSNTYQLAYQDKDGDWLLAQDVPWRQVHLLFLSILSFLYHNLFHLLLTSMSLSYPEVSLALHDNSNCSRPPHESSLHINLVDRPSLRKLDPSCLLFFLFR